MLSKYWTVCRKVNVSYQAVAIRFFSAQMIIHINNSSINITQQNRFQSKTPSKYLAPTKRGSFKNRLHFIAQNDTKFGLHQLQPGNSLNNKFCQTMSNCGLYLYQRISEAVLQSSLSALKWGKTWNPTPCYRIHVPFLSITAGKTPSSGACVTQVSSNVFLTIYSKLRVWYSVQHPTPNTPSTAEGLWRRTTPWLNHLYLQVTGAGELLQQWSLDQLPSTPRSPVTVLRKRE